MQTTTSKRPEAAWWKTVSGAMADGRDDDVDFLTAEHAAFPAVRVESGNRDTRFIEPEIGAQGTVGQRNQFDDRRAGKSRNHVGQGAVDGDQHDPQARSGEHHGHPLGTGSGGEHLGMAGERVTCQVQGGFGYRAGGDRVEQTFGTQ
jgi:hypothetical protein